MANDVVAQRIRRLRMAKGWTKSALARAAGVTTTCVWNWEEGNTRPREDSLARLSRALGVPPADIVPGAALPPSSSEASPEEKTSAEKTPAHEPSDLASIIRAARERIAQMAGLDPSKVQIDLDFGD